MIALSIVLRGVVMDIFKNLFHKMGATLQETKHSMVMFFRDVTNPKRAREMVYRKYLDVKRMTVRPLKRGFKVIVDKEHYSENWRKIVDGLGEVMAEVSQKAAGVV